MHPLPSASSILDFKDLTLPKCPTDPKFVAVSLGALLYNTNQTIFAGCFRTKLFCSVHSLWIYSSLLKYILKCHCTCVSNTPMPFKLPVITHERELPKIVFPPENA